MTRKALFSNLSTQCYNPENNWHETDVAITLTRDEVLSRDELEIDPDDTVRQFQVEGEWGENRFEDDDGEVWIPVVYKGQRRKKKMPHYRKLG